MKILVVWYSCVPSTGEASDWRILGALLVNQKSNLIDLKEWTASSRMTLEAVLQLLQASTHLCTLMQAGTHAYSHTCTHISSTLRWGGLLGVEAFQV